MVPYLTSSTIRRVGEVITITHSVSRKERWLPLLVRCAAKRALIPKWIPHVLSVLRRDHGVALEWVLEAGFTHSEAWRAGYTLFDFVKLWCADKVNLDEIPIEDEDEYPEELLVAVIGSRWPK